MAPVAIHEINVTEIEPMSRTYQYRKVMKPMLERKRRARMNKCVDELKELMVGVCSDDGEPITKLEKADVLDLTLSHLKNLQKHNALKITATSRNAENYLNGFRHCSNEVIKFINTLPGVDLSVSKNLLCHLSNIDHSLEKCLRNDLNKYEDFSKQQSHQTPRVIKVPISSQMYTPPASPDFDKNVTTSPQIPLNNHNTPPPSFYPNNPLDLVNSNRNIVTPQAERCEQSSNMTEQAIHFQRLKQQRLQQRISNLHSPATVKLSLPSRFTSQTYVPHVHSHLNNSNLVSPTENLWRPW